MKIDVELIRLMIKQHQRDGNLSSFNVDFEDTIVRLTETPEQLTTLSADKSGDVVSIYTDGACSGNPGPGGYGWVMYDEDGNEAATNNGGEPRTTNNRMELCAVIDVLSSLSGDYKRVDLYTDSQYVKDGTTKWINGWRKNNWKTAARKDVKNKDLWIKLDTAIKNCKCSLVWHWVKGHSNNIGNDRADELARQGAEAVK